jgi:hypothetical protein
VQEQHSTFNLPRPPPLQPIKTVDLDMFKMDKTTGSSLTHKQAEINKLFPAEASVMQRLSEGWYLSCIAYGIDPQNPPKMDKHFGTSRKHKKVPGNIFNNDFRDFIKAMNNRDVEYLLVGGYAVIIHGYRRSSGDMIFGSGVLKKIIKSLSQHLVISGYRFWI